MKNIFEFLQAVAPIPSLEEKFKDCPDCGAEVPIKEDNCLACGFGIEGEDYQLTNEYEDN